MKTMTATLVFIILVIGMLIFMLDDVRRVAQKYKQPVLKWQLIAVFSFFIGAAVIGLISAGLFLILEIGLIWAYATIIPSCIIMYFIVRERLKDSA